MRFMYLFLQLCRAARAGHELTTFVYTGLYTLCLLLLQ